MYVITECLYSLYNKSSPISASNLNYEVTAGRIPTVFSHLNIFYIIENLRWFDLSWCQTLFVNKHKMLVFSGCVDFVPACTQQASFTRPFAFEPFSAVVLRAQEWILQRTHLQVASVQSINYMIYSTWSMYDFDYFHSVSHMLHCDIP